MKALLKRYIKGAARRLVRIGLPPNRAALPPGEPCLPLSSQALDHDDGPSPSYARILAGGHDYTAAGNIAIQCIEIGRYDLDFLYDASLWLIYRGRLAELLDVVYPRFLRVAYPLKWRLDPASKTKLSNYCWEIGQEVLGKNGLRECLPFFYLANTVETKPQINFCIDLLHAVGRLKDQATELADRLHDELGEFPCNSIGAVVWGDEYVEAYLNYHVRSLLAPGNLPALTTSRNFLTIVTTHRGADQIRQHPIYEDLIKHCSVYFFCFPETLAEFRHYSNPDYLFYLLYGALDHVNIFFARHLNANVMLLPVDAIVGNGSLVNLVKYVNQGYDCCGNSNLVAKKETFLPALDALFPDGQPITLSTHELASLALRHRHQYVTSQLVSAENTDFGKWPRELFYPVEGGVIVRAIYMHPLIVSGRALRGDVVFPFKWVDFLLPDRIVPGPDFGRMKVITDCTEVYISNFAPGIRLFETSGEPFSVENFVAAHLHSRPVHRFMWQHQQFIPCTIAERTSRDPETDAAEILAILNNRAPL